MIYDFKTYIDKLNEGLITTYDMDITIEGIERILSEDDITFMTNILNNNTFEVSIKEYDKIKYLKETITFLLDSIFNLYGWFPSKMRTINIFGGEYYRRFNIDHILNPNNEITDVVLTFEAKFDRVCKNIPDKLYHLSIQEYEQDILSNGITVKNKSKLTMHGDRVYLCETKDDCMFLVNRMNKFYMMEKDSILYSGKNPKKIFNKNTKWIIYEIDSKEAKIDILYRDPNYQKGYYYNGYIRPHSIIISSKE